MELVNDVKIYRPGDPEFEALAATITPLHLNRKDLSSDKNLISASIDPATIELNRRREPWG